MLNLTLLYIKTGIDSKVKGSSSSCVAGQKGEFNITVRQHVKHHRVATVRLDFYCESTVSSSFAQA